MCVIELDGGLLRQAFPINVVPPKTTHQIGHGTRDQKVFLHETQSLSRRRRVIWIEHPGQRLRFQGSDQRTNEIARAEFLKIEVVGGSGGPEAESVDCLSSVPNHRTIKGNSRESGWPIWNHRKLSVLQLEAAVQLDFYCFMQAANFPWI